MSDDQGGLSRRSLLTGLLVTGAAGLSGCGGFSTGGGGGGSGGGGEGDALTFVTWASEAEEQAFRRLADSFEQAQGVAVGLQVVPFGEALTTVDTGLRSGQAPDVFRVTYNDVGTYRGRDVLAELPDAAALEPQFGPAFWQAVTDDAGTYGVRHHTDTSMVLCNLDVVEAAGITLPASRDEAWTFEEFDEVLRRVQATLSGSYAFAANWQQAGAYRWGNFVHAAGGRLFAPDLASAGLDAGATRALEYTQSWFAEGLVPPTSSTKGQFASDLFSGGTAAMALVGDFLLADIEDTVPFRWAATFLPRDQREAADLGGNALVATAGPRQEQALAFLEHCVQAEQMAEFCGATTVLPTRTDLDGTDLDYAVAPEVMPLYVEQAAAIPSGLVEQVTVEGFTAVNAALVERLEQAFIGGASVAQVIDDLAGDIDAALSQ